MLRAAREKSMKQRYGGRIAKAPKRQGPGGGPGRHQSPGARGGGQPKNTKAAMKRLLSYLEKDRGRMALAVFCVIVSPLATLAGS